MNVVKPETTVLPARHFGPVVGLRGNSGLDPCRRRITERCRAIEEALAAAALDHVGLRRRRDWFAHGLMLLLMLLIVVLDHLADIVRHVLDHVPNHLDYLDVDVS